MYNIFKRGFVFFEFMIFLYDKFSRIIHRKNFFFLIIIVFFRLLFFLNWLNFIGKSFLRELKEIIYSILLIFNFKCLILFILIN